MKKKQENKPMNVGQRKVVDSFMRKPSIELIENENQIELLFEGSISYEWLEKFHHHFYIITVGYKNGKTCVSMYLKDIFKTYSAPKVKTKERDNS